MEDLLLSIAASTAAFSAATLIQEWLRSRLGRASSRKEAFETAISSDDLKTVGRYLSEQFGRVPISSYVRNDDTRKSVNKILARLTAYVDADEEDIAASAKESAEVAKQQSAGMVDSELQVLMQPQPDDPSALQLAIKSVAAGDEWSGLARVRRDLERELQRRMVSQTRLPPFRMLQVLEPPSDVSRRFKAFSQVANAAVHGSDVEPVLAFRALENARRIYEWLAKVPVRNDNPQSELSY